MVKTPNLERLANSGMRFARGYADSPRCTPSRAAMFTGHSAASLHMTFINEGNRGGGGEPNTKLLPPHALMELPASEVTIAGYLRKAGYATAHFGKWHVGRVDPTQHGFDESDGPNGNGGPENVANPNPKQALAMTAKGIDFMERQARLHRPFYLHMSHYPSQGEKGGGGGGGKSRNEDFGLQEISAMDSTLGQVLDAVERLGLRGNTYILYTTDHGTPGRNPPLTGGKGTVWEGGLRVPFILSGPGIAAGSCSQVFVSALDLFPTFAGLAHATTPLPAGLEGGNFESLLFNKGVGVVKRPREEFVVHFPHYDKDVLGPASAIILGNYKLIRVYETNQRKLFDLSKDIAEQNDLAAQMPGKVAELDGRLNAYLQLVTAQMPVPNPNFDPSKPAELKQGGGKRGRKKETL